MEDRLKKNLFHLGKALWSEIPGGSLIAALYDANEDLLLGNIEKSVKESNLSATDIENLSKVLEKQLKSPLLQKIDSNQEEFITTVIGELARVEQSILGKIASIQDPTFSSRLQKQLDVIKETRQNWIGGISETQQELLNNVPKGEKHAISETDLFKNAEKIIKLEKARYEEKMMRMHELRWLGLIQREKRDGQNYYWRIADNPDRT